MSDRDLFTDSGSDSSETKAEETRESNIRQYPSCNIVGLIYRYFIFISSVVLNLILVFISPS